MEPWKLSLTAGVAGAILSIVVGLIFVPRILKWTEARMLKSWEGTIPKPSFAPTQAFWDSVWKRQSGGAVLGVLEVTIFFTSFFADGAWPLLASWLAFKVACQWESWKHSDGFIQKANNEALPEDLLAVQRWVSVRYISFLVGTGSNIVIALAVASVARAFLQANAVGLSQ